MAKDIIPTTGRPRASEHIHVRASADTIVMLKRLAKRSGESQAKVIDGLIWGAYHKGGKKG